MNNQYAQKNGNIEKILLARQDDLILNMLVVCNGREYLVCNHEDPINQAYEWIDKYIDPTSKAYIVFGMGFAYHLEVLLTSLRDKRVIIIEPDMDLFYHILSVRNLELIFEKALIFVEEENEDILNSLSGLFLETNEGGTQFQPFEVYAEMFPRQWEDIRYRFIKRVENFAVDIATMRRFGELFIYNNVKNAESISEAANAGALAGKFRNIPAILVSAGPSLDKCIPLLKTLTDKCIMIAAGTAVNILEENGITPHFMMGVDAAKEEGDIHKRVKSKEIFFLYSNQVATESVEAYTGPRFLMNYSADSFAADFFEYAGIDSEMYLTGPSVSNTSFDVLYKMGCNPIILVGQDMAYTYDQQYAGSRKGQVIDKESNLEEEGFIVVKDKQGNDVYTNHSYLTIRNWFEGYFEKVAGTVEIINSTEGGVNIELAENVSLAEVIKRYNFEKSDLKERIKQIYEENKFNSGINTMLIEYKRKLYDELEELEGYSERQLKLLDLIKRDVYHPAKSKNAFNRVSNQITEFTEKVLSSKACNILLRTIIGMDFFLIKREVDMATRNLSSYDEVKDFYIKAIEQQNSILKGKISRVKVLLKE